uniref:cellulase n=1 Tax=uncultured Bacillota bacterium TaxID=344338 RepID=A0A650ENA5_9FIRM|nr:hypothetical protein Firmicute1046_3160 [uncultured Firmicutes bacterium]
MLKIKKLLYLLPILLMFPLTALSNGQFPDVTPDDWYYATVTEMTANGYLNGYPDGSFQPDTAITAAEYVSVIARVCGMEKSATQNSHWAGGLLQTALNSGWYDWDEIPPTAETYDQPIARQLAVKVIMKAFAPDARGDYNTESAKIADFGTLNGRYYEPVLAAYAKGIATGDENGNFNPNVPLTRAEACALITRAMNQLSYSAQPYEEPQKPTPVTIATEKGVSKNGHLQVNGTQLCNERGEAIVLRGMSSHGIQWFPQFLTEDCIKATADSGANLFRIAMYTDENGYIANPSVKNTLINAADTAISLDMYVIIDWHILHDGNPNTYKEQAKAFFAEMAERYRGNPAVLYEICNEPNGGVTWEGDVKPYAEELIEVIRAIDDKAVILVGSPTWSQDLHKVAKSPIAADNLLYTCHFYAGTHTDWLRGRIADALNQNIPVFISEWGTSDASGSGGVYLEESEKWMEFLNANRISWANWSYCDKNESSAAVQSGANCSDGLSPDELTESGKFVFSHFND